MFTAINRRFAKLKLPIRRKYFHKAICQSGTALHEWLIQPDPVGKSKKVAELLGFRGGSQSETLGKMHKTL